MLRSPASRLAGPNFPPTPLQQLVGKGEGERKKKLWVQGLVGVFQKALGAFGTLLVIHDKSHEGALSMIFTLLQSLDSHLTLHERGVRMVFLMLRSPASRLAGPNFPPPCSPVFGISCPPNRDFYFEAIFWRALRSSAA